jgi:hypothetical protein
MENNSVQILNSIKSTEVTIHVGRYCQFELWQWGEIIETSIVSPSKVFSCKVWNACKWGNCLHSAGKISAHSSWVVCKFKLSFQNKESICIPNFNIICHRQYFLSKNSYVYLKAFKKTTNPCIGDNHFASYSDHTKLLVNFLVDFFTLYTGTGNKINDVCP